MFLTIHFQSLIISFSFFWDQGISRLVLWVTKGKSLFLLTLDPSERKTANEIEFTEEENNTQPKYRHFRQRVESVQMRQPSEPKVIGVYMSAAFYAHI